MALRLASMMCGVVPRSFKTPTSTCSTAPSTANQPSHGLIKNSSAMNTSEMGDSITAPTTGLCKKSRTVRKSFMGCTVPPLTWRRLPV